MGIRKAKFEDVNQIVDIKIDSWRATYKDILAEDYLNAMDKKKLEKRLYHHFFENSRIVYEKEKEILGFCVYGNRQSLKEEGYPEYDSEICAIYVKIGHLRNKIGQEMLQYAQRELKERGRIGYIIWCLKDNFPSREFYKKMGGKEIGEKTLYLNEEPYEEIGYGYCLNEESGK